MGEAVEILLVTGSALSGAESEDDSRWRRRQKKRMMMQIMREPLAVPTPIPACAPVVSPFLVCTVPGDAFGVDAAAAVPEGVYIVCVVVVEIIDVAVRMVVTFEKIVLAIVVVACV
jgi:hypothetical protein